MMPATAQEMDSDPDIPEQNIDGIQDLDHRITQREEPIAPPVRG
jgi:hypothetical protein